MNKTPFVSVIVPAFNEEKHIAECLSSLLALDYPKDRYNITVVDNNSNDNTASLIRQFNVQYLFLERGKVGAVRNYGVKCTESDIIAFIDADCIAGKTWLASGVEKLKDLDVGAVGGFCRLRDNPGWVEKAWVLGERVGNIEVNNLAGSSFLLERKMFESLDGFDESINAGEDSKLSAKITEKGYRLESIEGCAVTHLGYPNSLVGFAKRQFWHSSSYLKSNNGIRDRTFVAVVIFIISLLLTFLLALSENNFLALASFFVSVLVSVSFTIKRSLMGAYRKIYPANLFSAFFIDYVYFLSRALGLAFSFKLFFSPIKLQSDNKSR